MVGYVEYSCNVSSMSPRWINVTLAVAKILFTCIHVLVYRWMDYGVITFRFKWGNCTTVIRRKEGVDGLSFFRCCQGARHTLKGCSTICQGTSRWCLLPAVRPYFGIDGYFVRIHELLQRNSDVHSDTLSYFMNSMKATHLQCQKWLKMCHQSPPFY